MKNVIRGGGVMFASLCLMLTAKAGEAGLSGIVRDSSGPVQGAEIRIQGSDANRIGKIHTTANGRYNYPELEAGMYNVSLIVDGVTKASISNVRTKAGETQILNFEILKGSRVTPFAPFRTRRRGGMADALDSKSSDRKIVWVQVPPPAHFRLWDRILQPSRPVVTFQHEECDPWWWCHVCFALLDADS